MANRRTLFRAALEADGATPEEIDETLAELDAERDGKDPHARARRAGIPPLYLGVSFEDIEADPLRAPAIANARIWAKGGSRGLYLWSEGDATDDLTGFGSGKTRIAAAAAQHIVDLGSQRVRWLDVVRLMTDLNLSFKNPMYEQAAEKLRRPSPGDVVILDDIDKIPPTDRNIQPVYALVNDCVIGEVPLLITANRHPDDLQADWGDRFGHAAASRIIGHCFDVEVRGRDRRLDEVA